MALINCKECGKEISTTAENCPHCGCRTPHGRSITQAKGLLSQYVIWVVLIIIGVVLLFGSLKPLAELFDEYESVKHWYFYKDGNFLKYIAYEGKTGVLWKLIIGLDIAVTGIINMRSIKQKAYLIKGNGFDLERKEQEEAMRVEQADGWKCVSCGFVIVKSVGTCQSCGTTKEWSGSQER